MERMSEPVGKRSFQTNCFCCCRSQAGRASCSSDRTRGQRRRSLTQTTAAPPNVSVGVTVRLCEAPLIAGVQQKTEEDSVHLNAMMFVCSSRGWMVEHVLSRAYTGEAALKASPFDVVTVSTIKKLSSPPKLAHTG